MNQLDRLILINSPSPQLLSYDTTFQLGDYFVSPLLFRHTLFKESPVMPAIFLIHERKLQTAHEQLFQIASIKVPSLTHQTFPMVTDEERGIVNSIENHLPMATRLRCWNHIFRNARYWCKSHNIKNNEMQDFVTDLRDLFHRSTSEEYEAHLKQLSITWSTTLCQYCMKNIHPEVDTSIGRWALEKEGVYSPFS